MDENWINELINKSLFPLASHFGRKLGIAPVDSDSGRYMIPLSHLPDGSTSQPDLPLCDACSGISMEGLRSTMGYMHSMDFNDLLNSAQECVLCDRIRRNICNAVRFHIQRREPINDAHEALELFAEWEAENEGLFLMDPTPVILKLDRGGFDDGTTDWVVTGTIARCPQRGMAWLPRWGRLILHDDKKESIRPIRSRGSETQILERLSEWLKLSIAAVPSWSDASDEKPLPTRVLDLGDTDVLGKDIRLVETNGRRGRYVALSYCWGGYRDFRILSGNYKEGLDRIKFDQLPQVFADAVKVTRGLGIRYLWIDALCIIQEDAEDWQREAARMCNIYWNATCRVAVNDSKNPTEGFFPPQDIMASIRIPNLDERENSEPASKEDAYSSKVVENEDGRGIDELEEKVSSTRLEDPDGPKAYETNTPEKSLGASVGQHEPNDDIAQNATIESSDGKSPTQPDICTTEGGLCAELGQEGISRGSRGTTAPGNECSSVAIQDEAAGTQDCPSSEWLDDLMEEMEQKLFTDDVAPSESGEEENESSQMYLTLSRSYAIDVDRGLLNTRAWVLQERLLAPRTIHFTKNNIYCEDQDDLCGEDWVRRYFTWMSSIHKQSTCTQIALFPERNFNSASKMTQNSSSQWISPTFYRQTETLHVADPWLRVCENFSQCNISYQTDRLAAIAGLVMKKEELQSLSPPSSDDADKTIRSRNFFGLWERNLHIELAWASHKQSKLNFLHSLNLPSWTWIAYNGRVRFTKELRERDRDAGPVRLAPFPELELLDADVPGIMTPLPLASAASLTVQARLRKIHAISDHITSFNQTRKSRDELASSVPFFYDEHTGTNPVLLSSLSMCNEIFDDADSLVGFVSLDEGREAVGDMFCAHISTLRDEDMQSVTREFDKPGVKSVDMSKWRKPILAYALVLARAEGDENRFRRVGLAEVNYEWICDGASTVIRLF